MVSGQLMVTQMTTNAAGSDADDDNRGNDRVSAQRSRHKPDRSGLGWLLQ